MTDRSIRSRSFDDRATRRRILAHAARAALGVGFLDTVAGATRGAAAAGGKPAHANVICLFMKGAMSHIDTFDPKPGREEQGETRTIGTAVPGVSFGAGLPRLAALADRLAIVRSLSTETGAHEPGVYTMRTAYAPLGSIQHPALGAWALHAAGKRAGDLPGYVLVGNGNEHPGAGFLDPKLAPVPVADPKLGLENTRRPGYLSEKNFERRLALADRIDRDFRRAYAGPQVEAYNQMVREAVRLLGSDDLGAFDLSREPEAVRRRYGDGPFAQGCLLARRLVEAGVRFVEVEFGGWDMHRELFDELPGKVAQLDNAMATLLDDLAERGLADETLVVLVSEFGRTPRINENAGRDHHPGVFSAVLAGHGIRGGVVHGASDERGHSPAADGVSVADLNTTIAAAAGLPFDREFIAPNGRPFKIGGGGKPIATVLA
jgi:hypothetical protein